MTKKEKYNKLLEVFEDSHISEIEHAFAKYAPLCSEARCEECPLAIGESCIKIVFEQKWELQDLYQKQKKILDFLKPYLYLCHPTSPEDDPDTYYLYLGENKQIDIGKKTYDLLTEVLRDE